MHQGRFYVNAPLEKLMLEELRNSCRPGQVLRQFLYVQSCMGILEGGWVPAWSQTDCQCSCPAGDCGAQCRPT